MINFGIKKSKYVDLVFHHLAKDHNKSEVLPDELDFRTKIVFNVSASLGSTLERWIRNCFYGVNAMDASEATILTFKNDEPVELDLDKEIRNLQLTSAMKLVRCRWPIFFVTRH